MPHPHIDINAEESTGDDGARQLIFRSEELSSKDAVSIIQPLFKAHAVLIQIDALILGAIEKVVGQEEEVETTPYRTYGGVI